MSSVDLFSLYFQYMLPISSEHKVGERYLACEAQLSVWNLITEGSAEFVVENLAFGPLDCAGVKTLMCPFTPINIYICFI